MLAFARTPSCGRAFRVAPTVFVTCPLTLRTSTHSARVRMAATEEKFDVLDNKGVHTGTSVARSIVHRDGLWHRSTHIWILSRARASVLLQKRSLQKDTFPGRWDVSAAGHISAGDQSAVTAARELEEELGIGSGSEDALDFKFTAQVEATGEAGGVGFVDREFQDVYLFRSATDVEESDVSVQEEEVEEVRYWSLQEYKTALLEKDPRFVPRGPDYMDKFLPFLDEFLSEAG